MMTHGIDSMASGVAVYPHVAGWDAPTATRPALTAAGTVALFDNAALREFAQALVNADMIKADYLIDALIDALEMPHDDVDVDEQLRVTQ